jgi:hypothetical protein
MEDWVQQRGGVAIDDVRYQTGGQDAGKAAALG